MAGRCGAETSRGTPCTRDRERCPYHGVPAIAAELAAKAQGEAALSSGASGFSVSAGVFSGPGLDHNTAIREEKGFGKPWGDAGIIHQMMLTLPSLYLLYTLVSAPIRSLNWDFRYESQAKTDPAILDFVRVAYFDKLEKWDSFIANKCLSILYGFMPIEAEEVTEKGAVFWRRMLPRMPFSVTRVKRSDERLAGIEQYAQKADDGPQKKLTIDADRLLWYSHNQQGDHLTGIPLARQGYGPWKNILHAWRAMGIRIDRVGTPTPVWMLEPEDFKDQVVKDDLAEVGKHWRMNEYSHLIGSIGPNGKNTFHLEGGVAASDDIIQWCRYNNWEILSIGAGQFLALGTTSTGSRSVGDVQARVFWRSLQSVVQMLCEPLNDVSPFAPLGSIKRLVDANFGPQETYPTVFAPVPRAESLESLANALKTLVDARFITPTVADQKLLRDEQFLPSLTPEQEDTVREALFKSNLPEVFAYHLDRGVVERNEARDRLGFEPRPDGDTTVPEWFRDQGLAPDGSGGGTDPAA